MNIDELNFDDFDENKKKKLDELLRELENDDHLTKEKKDWVLNEIEKEIGIRFSDIGRHPDELKYLREDLEEKCRLEIEIELDDDEENFDFSENQNHIHSICGVGLVDMGEYLEREKERYGGTIPQTVPVEHDNNFFHQTMRMNDEVFSIFKSAPHFLENKK